MYIPETPTPLEEIMKEPENPFVLEERLWREKVHPLTEMALSPVNDPSDKLPFDVIIRIPDHNPPHAHLYPKGDRNENSQIGEFLIPRRPPKFANDIEGHREGVTEDQKERLAVWMPQRNKRNPKLTNWETLKMLHDLALVSK